jgi:pilus assembly protein Flp/PilA
MSVFACFIKDESGATAIEYNLIAALLSVAIIGTLTALGGSLDATYTSILAATAGALARVARFSFNWRRPMAPLVCFGRSGGIGFEKLRVLAC